MTRKQSAKRVALPQRGLSSGNDYREGLIKALSGNKVDLVGSVRSGSIADNDHEGQNGYAIDEIPTAVTNTLSRRPSVLSRHILTPI